MTFLSLAVAVTLYLPSQVLHLHRGYCLSDERQGISCRLSSEVPSVRLALCILKLDFNFPVRINVLLKMQILAVKKGRGGKTQLNHPPVLHKMFSKIPSYA